MNSRQINWGNSGGDIRKIHFETAFDVFKSSAERGDPVAICIPSVIILLTALFYWCCTCSYRFDSGGIVKREKELWSGARTIG